jgi:hypothetical protein
LTIAQFPHLGRNEDIDELTKKVEKFFKDYGVNFYPPDNIYRIIKGERSPICIVFATSSIQGKVLGQFSRRDLQKGDSVEAKLPHKERSTRADIRGLANGKPYRA